MGVCIYRDAERCLSHWGDGRTWIDAQEKGNWSTTAVFSTRPELEGRWRGEGTRNVGWLGHWIWLTEGWTGTLSHGVQRDGLQARPCPPPG